MKASLLPRTPAARGHWALLAAVTIWGGTYVVTDAALERSGPFTILALRFVLALAFLAPFAYRRGWRPRQAFEARFVLFGLTGIVLHLALETSGLLFTTPAEAALVIASAPAVTAAFAAVLLGERPGAANLIGIGLSIAGVLLVAYTPSPGGGRLAMLGNLMVFGGVVAWGIFTVQGRRLGGDHSPLVSTAAAVTSSLLFLVPLAAGEIAISEPPDLDAAGVAAILYLGLLASGAAFALWNGSLRYVSASSAGGYVNLVPVIGIALAVATGDSLGPGQLAGGVIVGAGVWLSSRRSATERV